MYSLWVSLGSSEAGPLSLDTLVIITYCCYKFKDIYQFDKAICTDDLLSPVKRGDIGFSFSVCPSSRQSVCPASCPGYVSESTQWKVFKLHLWIEHQSKVCNVVFSFDLMKKYKNEIILKMYENLGNIRPRVQAISP